MFKRKAPIMLAVFITSPLWFVGAAGASYSGTNAALYADFWWNSGNPAYYSFDTDCTNFVTQGMAIYGFPIVRGQYQNSNVFYNDTLAVFAGSPTLQAEDGRAESLSGTVADSLFTYLRSGAGSLIGNYSYAADGAAPSYMPSSIVKGDVLFYDWGQGMGVSHVSMMVGSGTDTDGYVGDWIDQHSNDRYHEFWTLKETNAYWQTTTVYYFHI